MQDIISIHFIITILHKTTPSLRPQTASKKRKRDDDDDSNQDDCITISKAYYSEILKLASATLFEGCYGKTTSEMMDWIDNMNKKIADAAAASPLTDEQRKRLNIVDAKQLNIVDIDCIAGLKCSLDSVQNQMTRIATQVASLTTSQTEILTNIQQMRKDIYDLEQERKGGGSFGFRDEDGYKRCRSEICGETEMKMYTMHTCYLDCVKEMMRESHWWDEGGWFKIHMDTFVQLALDGSIGSEEWLNCYKEIVNNMERDKEACAKRKVAIPNKIHHLAKQLSLDALLTTDEERDAGHTMVSCDLTDCHYCDEKKKKTATLLL